MDLDLTESMLKDVNQIREQQARDLRDLLATDLAKMRPKPMRPAALGHQAALSHEKVEELAKKRLSEKQAEEEQRQLAAAVAPKETQTFEKPAAEEAESSSSEFEEADNSGPLLLPSQRAQAAKKRGRKNDKCKAQGKSGKGKKKGGAVKDPSIPLPAHAVPQPSISAASTLAAQPRKATVSSFSQVGSVGGADSKSTYSGGSRRVGSQGGTSISDVHQRILELSVFKVLGGEQLGDRFYAVKRKIEEIEVKDPGSADLVLLRAHQAVAFVARDSRRGWGSEIGSVCGKGVFKSFSPFLKKKVDQPKASCR